MKAMILAAGRGERMMPLTEYTPKPLLQVNGKPLLEYHIIRLKNAGFSDIVINHCYLGEQIEAYFGDGSRWHVNISWSPESKALETAGGIRQALDLLGDQPFLVVNGDIWTDYPFHSLPASEFVDSLKHQQTLAHLILINNPIQNSAGDFGLIANKVTNHAKSMWTFSGIALYHPAFIKSCQPLIPQSLTPMLREAATLGLLTGEVYSGEWRDIGTPERLSTLEQDLKNQSDLCGKRF
ncbi:N-acetylmuramate alpha-1-phosphate uridylyltransferase MurU [Aliikangiella maris]|uniref:N-acetylmuramate alpha-1-phosphate uridylyltransferase MurU n=2 Tax=Aliikangiella maris TaxID=3162458 RepID=A0ABV2BRH2_9GAMM